jgi:ABC-type glycerol-3-phosphate transport system substrate-binding protein
MIMSEEKKIFKHSVSRRTFLKGTAAAVAAGLAGGGMFAKQGIFAPRIARAQSGTVVLAIQEFAHEIVRGVLPEFEETTGLTVELEGGPTTGNDMLTKYSAAFASGTSPVDVMSDADDSSPTFMRAGWVKPLNDIIPQDTWDDFPASMNAHIDGFSEH